MCASIARFAEPVYYRYPRWSPDAKWIAYQRGDGVRWDIFASPPAAAPPSTHARQPPDPWPRVAARQQRHRLQLEPRHDDAVPPDAGALGARSRWRDRSLLTPADLSYLHPDIHASGAVVASRLQMQFDLWRYPTDGTPEENVRRAIRITRQSGQVQTPTVGADDRDIAFLSDSGGHANIWVLTPRHGELRQITYERDAAVALGVPIWSPDGKWIAFVSSRGNTGLGFGIWLVIPTAATCETSPPRGLGVDVVSRCPVGLLHRCRRALQGPDRRRLARARQSRARRATSIGFDGTTLYFMVDRTLTDASPASRFTPRRLKTRRRGCSRGFRRAARRSGRSSTRHCRLTDSRSRCR